VVRDEVILIILIALFAPMFEALIQKLFHETVLAPSLFTHPFAKGVGAQFFFVTGLGGILIALSFWIRNLPIINPPDSTKKLLAMSAIMIAEIFVLTKIGVLERNHSRPSTELSTVSGQIRSRFSGTR
jgi:hypothetical protein